MPHFKLRSNAIHLQSYDPKQEGILLNLTELDRKFLTTVGALASDARGDEILIGLTASESDFFLMYQGRHDRREPAYKTHQYYRLMGLHLDARKLMLEPRNPKSLAGDPL
jgi:hypothetical protein